MDKETKIIIIGFGSIGRRHYNNLKKLGFKNVYVFDIVQKKINSPSIKMVDNINLAALKQFGIAFICSPNHLHIKHALSAAKAGCDLFIEKPLSHNLKGIKELANLCQKNKLTNMTACNMRFHPAIQFIKNYLDKEKIGKVYSIHLECGNYLPYWRKNQDYRKTYAAKKSSGGGVILDDIHEFDLLFWLNDFEKVKQAKFIFDKVSDLQIETEDCSVAGFKFQNKVLGSVSSDYLQQAYSRRLKIVGEKATLEWDFKENIVWLKTRKAVKNLFQVKNYDKNNMYIEELKYFFRCLKNRQPIFNDIKTASGVLKYVIRPSIS